VWHTRTAEAVLKLESTLPEVIFTNGGGFFIIKKAGSFPVCAALATNPARSVEKLIN
jgi:hypothetical protein